MYERAQTPGCLNVQIVMVYSYLNLDFLWIRRVGGYFERV